MTRQPTPQELADHSKAIDFAVAKVKGDAWYVLATLPDWNADGTPCPPEQYFVCRTCKSIWHPKWLEHRMENGVPVPVFDGCSNHPACPQARAAWAREYPGVASIRESAERFLREEAAEKRRAQSGKPRSPKTQKSDPVLAALDEEGRRLGLL